MHIRLCTMMLNEAETLPRLAEGCKGIIDSWLIVDDVATTDDSANIAEQSGRITYAVACRWAEKGLNLPRTEDGFFVMRWVEEEGLRREMKRAENKGEL